MDESEKRPTVYLRYSRLNLLPAVMILEKMGPEFRGDVYLYFARYLRSHDRETDRQTDLRRLECPWFLSRRYS